MNNDAEIKMYGMPKARIVENMEDWIGPQEMLTMSLLSDAQELMQRNRFESARQTINQVKYITSLQLEKRLTEMK